MNGQPVQIPGRGPSRSIASGGQGQLRYLVSYPPNSVPGHGRLPVLCFLHGVGEAEPMDIDRAMQQHGPLKGGRACEMVDRFILVAPQLPQGQIWGAAAHAGEVRRIVEAVADGDPSRRFLTGFSTGGDGVLLIATGLDVFWAKAWPVDPPHVARANVWPENPRCALWVSMGPLSRPVPLAAGIPPAQVDAAIAAAVNANNRRVSVDEGQVDGDLDPQTGEPFRTSAHVRTATRAYGRNSIYDWLLT